MKGLIQFVSISLENHPGTKAPASSAKPALSNEGPKMAGANATERGMEKRTPETHRAHRPEAEAERLAMDCNAAFNIHGIRHWVEPVATI